MWTINQSQTWTRRERKGGSKIMPTSFIAGPSGDGTPKPEKKKEPAEANHKEEAKKEHKESSREKTPKESQTEPKKKQL